MQDSAAQPTITYCDQRLSLLGILPEENSIRLKFNSLEHERTLNKDYAIFRPSTDVFDNIKILVYNLEREPIQIDVNTTKQEYKRVEFFEMTRLKEPIVNEDGDQVKYIIPKGQGTFPFFPPALVEKFEKKEKIEKLILTEGYFKAFSGCKNGLDVIGLSSITHARNKKTGAIHSDIESLIRTCDVDEIYILFDGDCRKLSKTKLEKDGDLSQRINSFYSAAYNIYMLLKDMASELGIQIFFSTINSDEIEGNPKGLDDLFVQFNNSPAITEAFSKRVNPYFIHKLISKNINVLKDFFHIDDAQKFYEYYKEQMGTNKNTFIYFGSKFVVNYEGKAELKLLGNYVRIGIDYYKLVEYPNKFQTILVRLAKWNKATIIEDLGKHAVSKIEKYDAFCTVPDHVNWKQVIHNNYNKYCRFIHEPIEGECPLSLAFVQHIFGDMWEKGMDYIQIMYENPIQILPILCLVSTERETGKTTFMNWMARIFQGNVVFVGSEDLSNPFNDFLRGKLIAGIDEALVDKISTVEKIKNIATAHEILMNAKGKEQEQVDVFIKFIFCSNNEESFMFIPKEEKRFWVIKVHSIKSEVYNHDFLGDLTKEIPYFIYYLRNRKLTTTNKTRMWFDIDEITTDALRKVQYNSKPKVHKTIDRKIRQMFVDFPLLKIQMTCRLIKLKMFQYDKDIDEFKVAKILKEMNVQQQLNESGQFSVHRYEFIEWRLDPENGEFKHYIMKDIGRPYVFFRRDYITVDEDEQLIYPKEMDGISELIDHGEREKFVDVNKEKTVQNNLPF